MSWIVQVIGVSVRRVRAIRRFTVRPVLPPALAALNDLALNLRWSWHPPTQDVFSAVDPDLWEETGRDPVRLLVGPRAAREQQRLDRVGLLVVGERAEEGEVHAVEATRSRGPALTRLSPRPAQRPCAGDVSASDQAGLEREPLGELGHRLAVHDARPQGGTTLGAECGPGGSPRVGGGRLAHTGPNARGSAR
mgnify:CR=1 FL=1